MSWESRMDIKLGKREDLLEVLEVSMVLMAVWVRWFQ